MRAVAVALGGGLGDNALVNPAAVRVTTARLRVGGAARRPASLSAAAKVLVGDADARVEDVDERARTYDARVVVLAVGAGALVDAVDAPREGVGDGARALHLGVGEDDHAVGGDGLDLLVGQ